MKRLIKKASSAYMLLHSSITRAGYPFEFNARILANRLYYSIIMTYPYGSSSFYDTESFDDAFDFYVDMVSALVSLTQAEQVVRLKQTLLSKAKFLLEDTAVQRYRKQHTPFYKKPLFLGISDPC